jgi:peptide/nickel transport system permease protein
MASALRNLPVGGQPRPGAMAGQRAARAPRRQPAATASGRVASGGALTLPADTGHAPASGSVYRQIFRTFAENRLALAGVAIVILTILFCFLGPFFYHTDQVHTNLAGSFAHPGADAHPLGTDQNGYDVLGRLMLGGQTSIEIGLAAAFFATGFGAVYGAISGFIGGVIDGLMMRIVDAMLAIPALFLLPFIFSLLSNGITLWWLIVIVAVIAWQVPARLIRGETLSLRVREYVEAVRVMGGSSARIVRRHILPNAIGTIVVNATLLVADAILTVAALSFLGLGIPPPATNWGQMLSDGTQFTILGYWWLIYPPGLAIVLLVVAFNFIGDALRDSFEVRLQRR